MSSDNFISIFPARQTWDQTTDDVNSVSADTKNLRLVTRAKGIEKLQQLQQLEALWCFHLDQKALDQISKATSLKKLYVDGFKGERIRSLRKLPALNVISIDTCSKIDSLAEFSDFNELEGLAIIHFSRVHDVSPLSNLTNLQQLAIAGSMWTTMKIKSLSPLSTLRNLRYLHLSNLKPEDGSLRPLEEMTKLEELDLANFYPMEEFAWLSGRLKNTKCTWFSPFVKLPFGCSKCGDPTTFMLTGKGKRHACEKCDADRLARHVAEFENIAKQAQAN